MIARDDIISLRERVLRLTRDVQELEREFDSSVHARSAASDDPARAAAVRQAAVASDKLQDARHRLSEAKRILAKAEGDEHQR